MAELSPAAAAVLRAAGDSEPGIYATIAAALRAYALLVSKHDPCIDVCPTTEEEAMVNGIIWRNRQIYEELLIVADEIDSINHTSEENFDD